MSMRIRFVNIKRYQYHSAICSKAVVSLNYKRQHAMASNTKIAAVLGTLLLCAGTAQAGTYNVSVSEGVTNGNSFDTATFTGFSGTNTASASFTYTGALYFDNTAGQNSAGADDLNSTFGFSKTNVSNYFGAGTVTYDGSMVANYGGTYGLLTVNPTNFLASSGSAGGFAYGSFYTIDLGKLAAGTVLTITHDDGIALFQGATRIGNTVSGATSAVTDVVDVTKAGDTVLRYARENGTPSILEVSEAPVPEPVSWGVLAIGLAGLYALRRPKRIAA